MLALMESPPRTKVARTLRTAMEEAMTLAVTALIPAAAIVSGGTVVADMAAEAGIRLIGLQAAGIEPSASCLFTFPLAPDPRFSWLLSSTNRSVESLFGLVYE